MVTTARDVQRAAAALTQAAAKAEREWLATLEPADRARGAEILMAEHRHGVGRMARARSIAIAVMRAGGMSAVEIGEELGVSRQAVHRMLKGDAA